MPFPEYPRPQLIRNNWLNLNGPWEYAINASAKIPETYDGEITVPFSPETQLSGVNKQLKPGMYLWYRRTIELPAEYAGTRLLLHFGAVDQEATVWINDMQVVSHVGGYLPFEAEITDAADSIITIVVRVQDFTGKSWHTRGKQKTNRGGMWYTPQSGIWQTVWLESVPNSYISQVKITPLFDKGSVEVACECDTRDENPQDKPFAVFNGVPYELPAEIPVENFIPWTPENPHLYQIHLVYGEDRIQSYFAMRKFSVEADADGKPRLFLNGAPYYHNGILDQGYWPDGLYTPPSDDAMVYDISVAKASGFNMIRKHIKVEPLRWYYHCDRLGMLVWQDMPCGGSRGISFDTLRNKAPLITGIHLGDGLYFLEGRSSLESRAEFKQELGNMVRHLYNCPCIAVWVVFNEGWGQFDAKKMYEYVRSIDSTRTVDHASGWHDRKCGELKSIHVYFKKYRFRKDGLGRAVVLSEFGGYAHAVQGHLFNNKEYGYKKLETPGDLEFAISELYSREIKPAIEKGLAASVYTQLTDVEEEVNGLMTYDRRIIKVPPDTMRTIVISK